MWREDPHAGQKHRKAKDTLRAFWENNNGVVSAQTLEEFDVNVPRKIPQPLSKKRGWS